jgi:hypothetical protein
MNKFDTLVESVLNENNIDINKLKQYINAIKRRLDLETKQKSLGIGALTVKLSKWKNILTKINSNKKLNKMETQLINTLDHNLERDNKFYPNFLKN